MRPRQRDVLGGVLAFGGAGFVGVLLLTANAPGIMWRLALGFLVLLVIIDNVLLLLGKERWSARFLKSRRHQHSDG